MQRNSIVGRGLILTAGLLLGAGLALGSSPAHAAKFSGPLGKAVAKGKNIFLHDTFGGRGLTCDTCHTAGGMGPTQVPGMGTKGPSLKNAAAVFPRYKQDDGKVITLEDQIHGCIAGALRGKAPAYNSETMRALVTYVTSLAQGQKINLGGDYK